MFRLFESREGGPSACSGRTLRGFPHLSETGPELDMGLRSAFLARSLLVNTNQLIREECREQLL